MWKRKELKKNARRSIRQNYWRMVSVCFLITLLTASYPLATAFLGVHPLSHIDTISNLHQTFETETTSQILEETATRLFHNTDIENLYQNPSATYTNLLVDLYADSTSTFFAVLKIFNTFLDEHFDFIVFILGISAILAFLYRIFVNNILIIGEKRFFLESKNYKDTRISKIFFLYKLHYIRRPAFTMFFRSLYQFLWNFTVIGGIYKHYEYWMIPYILAENPRISKKNAFFLSRQLSNHNKKKLLLLDLSFLGWKMLSLLSLGLVDFLYVNPYMATCKAELYLTLRRNYVLSRSPGYEYLDDSYLEHIPSEDELLISKALYDDSEGPYTQTSYFAPDQYPVFLFSVQPPFSAVRSPVNPVRKYDLWSCIFLFHAFSIFGWIVENLIHLLKTGEFSFDGAVFFPWAPMYGIFGILLLLFMKKLIPKPELVFFLNFAVYTLIEYLASWILELGYSLKVTAYSDYLFTLNEHTYIGGSAVFALLGCAFLYYLAPKWTEAFSHLKKNIRIVLCILLSLIFLGFVFKISLPYIW